MIVPDVNLLIYAETQIAALALQEKAIVHSNDTDFLRFPGLRFHNPLTGKNHDTL